MAIIDPGPATDDANPGDEGNAKTVRPSVCIFFHQRTRGALESPFIALNRRRLHTGRQGG